jgi:DNA-binding CsgD family transcriptional regulator
MNCNHDWLKQSDIRKVFHLVGEITELGRDSAGWRTHMLTRLIALTNSRVAFGGEHFISPKDPNDTRVVGAVSLGWEPGEQEVFLSYLNSGGMARDPLHAETQKLLHRSYTRRRRDLVPDEIWYASPVVEPIRRQANVDDTMYSRWNLPQPGWANMISLMRSWGAAPYSDRDRRVVNLLHRELGRLWSQVDAGPLRSLPPRLRQALDMMLNGYSEKEMATALNLSIHTVHDFARRLYRHFGATGRGDLITQPVCRQLMFRPALAPAYYDEHRSPGDDTFPQED